MEAVLQSPPKLVYDDSGELVEVILSAADFRAYLATLKRVDWESLPRHLQDAFDVMLIDEVRGEKKDAIPLESVLAGDGSE